MSRIIRVFPRRTRATPDDALSAIARPPSLLDEADEVHVSVAFSYDKPYAERLADQWGRVAPVKIGGPAYERDQPYSMEFEAGRYVKAGYTFTSRGCPRRCWFCGVWKRLNAATPILDFPDGWNILDDNLLACPRDHVERVFAMLRRQRKEDWPGTPFAREGRVEFTGGLEALSLEDYQVDLLASLTPRPNMFFAYDPGDAFETLESAARRMLSAGFTRESHRLRCYVMIGGPRKEVPGGIDTFASAEARLRQMVDIGFTPFAMLWRPSDPSEEKYAPGPEWDRFKRDWMRPAIVHHGSGSGGGLF